MTIEVEQFDEDGAIKITVNLSEAVKEYIDELNKED